MAEPIDVGKEAAKFGFLGTAAERQIQADLCDILARHTRWLFENVPLRDFPKVADKLERGEGVDANTVQNR